MSKFTQVNTAMRTVQSPIGAVQFPDEVARDGIAKEMHFYSPEGSIIATALWDSNKIVDFERGGVKHRSSKPVIKVQVSDIDGDGQVTLSDLMSPALLDEFIYPSVPLTESIGV